MPRRVDQLSGAIRACAQGPAVSTNHPGQLRSRSDDPRVRPAVLGDAALGLRVLDVDQTFRALGPWSEGLRGRPTVPHDSGPCPMARVFDQLSRANRPRVRWHAWSTSSPRDSAQLPGLAGSTISSEPFVLWSECQGGRPAIPGDSNPGPRACGVGRLFEGPPWP